jgi:hypothetical protein
VPIAQFFSPTDTEGGDSALRSLVEDLGDKELLTLVELRLNQGLKWADR